MKINVNKVQYLRLYRQRIIYSFFNALHAIHNHDEDEEISSVKNDRILFLDVNLSE
jgi:hypothetical protein